MKIMGRGVYMYMYTDKDEIKIKPVTVFIWL